MKEVPIVVVTGGAGFIGSHMVDLAVERGCRVHIIDNLAGGRLLNLEQHRNNPAVVFEQRDIRAIAPNDALFRGAAFVFHFAGIGDIVPSIERPLDYMSTNALGTVHVLEAARHAGVRKLVYAASSTCYGLAPALPTPEEAPILPQYPYALSKHQGEAAVLHWGQVYHLPVASIRIFNAYGTRSRTTGAYGAVFGVFLAQKLAGRPLTIVGDGTQRRDFVYVTDVVQAFYAAATNEGRQGIYNLGAGNPQTINHLADLLGGPRTHIPTRPGEPECTWADIRRIRADLAWTPRVSFEDGVKTMVANIDYWREAPVWEESTIAAATKSWFAYLTRNGAAE